MLAASPKPGSRVRLSGFDYVVFAGALVNAVVVAYLVGYWVLAG
ncbi:MAG: hypothetical protein WBO23_16825 [Burkholderiales bacterium]